MDDTTNDGGLRRPELRLSATLLFAGVVASLLAGLQHPDAASANDHPATFAEYAASDAWIAVHLGQFVGMALLLCGLLVLAYALNVRHGAAAWAVRLGAAAAIARLAPLRGAAGGGGWLRRRPLPRSPSTASCRVWTVLP